MRTPCTRGTATPAAAGLVVRKSCLGFCSVPAYAGDYLTAVFGDDLLRAALAAGHGLYEERARI